MSFAFSILLLFFSSYATAGLFSSAEETAEKERIWRESTLVLPPMPDASNLIDFYVSAASPHRYALDSQSIVVGNDGIVRYTLVIEAAGGARNIRYEGIRCDKAEWQLYATGRADGHWSVSRDKDWRKIEEMPANRHHAALYVDHFCPEGGVVGTKEIIDSLRYKKNKPSNF